MEGSKRQHFHGAYVRSTRSVLEEAEAGGFIDGDWAERWGLAFAQLYMDAFDAWEGFNEPVADTPDKMKRLADFEAERVRLLAEQGV